ncbi:MAG: YdbL family protein [Sphingomonas bacterium]|nr:YdbL family protein [Sphingomonas bacterium]
MMLAVWLTVLAAPVAAQSSPVIVAARSAGQVGERYDGYLGYAEPPASRLRAQVEAVNIRRRAFYSDLAVKRGASRVDVGITAGCELLGSVAVGEAYLLGDNVWRRRSPGEALPIPNYCRR